MRRRTMAALLSTAMVATVAPAVSGLERRPGTGMLVIAHRGAPVYASEGTQRSFALASDVGADLLEGDLTMSKDGRLVICHDIELSRVTDVENRPAFANRKSVRTINGVNVSGFWVDDFTWAELRNLRTADGQGLMVFEDLLTLARNRGRGLYVEVKESDYYLGLQRGLDPVAKLAATLKATGEQQRNSRVWIQSSNPTDLQRLRSQVGNRLVFLTRGVSPDDVWLFRGYRAFADVLAVPTTRARRQLVQQAHAADLGLHVWTLRGSRDAYRKAAAIGADGVITDFPDVGISVRNRVRRGGRPTGLTTRIENGNAIATWASTPGSRYAVTFDFGDPLTAPTIWTTANTASYPMADAKQVEVTVSRFSGNSLSDDAFGRASLTPRDYQGATVRTRVREARAVVSSDAMTRVVGVMEKLKKGKKWVPLRRTRGWLRGRGNDGTDVRRNFRTDKQGRFYLTVQVREDVLSGYVPARSWMVGVTATGTLRPSSSTWLRTEEGTPPARPKASVKKNKVTSLTTKDVRIKVRRR